MAGLWLVCMLALVTINLVTGKLDMPVSDNNRGLHQMSDTGTGCSGDPHGDSLKHMCDPWHGVTCCLYRDDRFGIGLVLRVEGGNDIFLRMLFTHLPKDNITTLFLLSHLRVGGSWCILAELQTLAVNFQLIGPVQGLTCLTQLRSLTIISVDFSVTPDAFRGLNHLFSLDISVSASSLSTDGLLQLRHAKELKHLNIDLTQKNAVLDAWPLCLAQTLPGISIDLSLNGVMAFTNTISPPTM